MVKYDQGVAAYISPEGQEVINSKRNNRKDNMRAGERQHGSHPNKSHHRIKGRQQAVRQSHIDQLASLGADVGSNALVILDQ